MIGVQVSGIHIEQVMNRLVLHGALRLQKYQAWIVQIPTDVGSAIRSHAKRSLWNQDDKRVWGFKTGALLRRCKVVLENACILTAAKFKACRTLNVELKAVAVVIVVLHGFAPAATAGQQQKDEYAFHAISIRP